MKWKLYINSFKIVFPCSPDFNIAVPFPPGFRNRDNHPSAEIARSKGFIRCCKVETSLVNKFSSKSSGFRTKINYFIGSPDYLFLVLHNQNGISKVPEFFQYPYQEICIARVKPILGSSSIYIEPTRLLPREVERFILCDSPPDSVEESLSRVRYGRPTSIMNFRRTVISLISRSEILASVSLRSILEKTSYNFPIGIETISCMDFPPTFTYPASFRNLDPLHSGQTVLPR